MNADRWYSRLLSAYPSTYRARFGDDMRETFAHDLRRMRAAGGGRVLVFWAITIAQALWFGAAERLRTTARARATRVPVRMNAADLLRYSLRQFRRQPLYAFGCAATLALGVAAATTSFAVAKRALLDPLPYPDGDRLVSILTASDGRTTAVSFHVLEDLRAAGSAFAELAPIRPQAFTYSTAEATETVGANAVTHAYFAVLGTRPALGRTWMAHEPDAVVVSWGFWQRALGGDANALGRRLTLDGAARTVVGVMPAEFVPPYWTTTAVWCSLDEAALMTEPRGRRQLTILGRTADGATAADVDAFLQVFTASLRERLPAVHGGQAWIAEPLRDELVGPARPALVGTAVAGVVLLFVVCANIAGLSAARAMGARHQLAVRTALGATRGRLFLERLSDSLVIAAVGSAAGVWAASYLVTVAASYQQQFLGRLPSLALDARTAIGGALAGLLVAVAAALLPGTIGGASRPADDLKANRASTGDRRLAAARAALVAVQVAMALVLIVGAGLLVRTVTHLSTTDFAFDTARVTTFPVNMTGARYRTREAQVQFERDVLDRLRAIPGVTAASASVGVPVIGGMGAGLFIEGRPKGAAPEEIAYFSVSPEFMSSFSIPIRAGRDLTFNDTAASPRVVLINETMARRYWPEGNALGARVDIGAGTPTGTWITVVGIVPDMRLHGPTEEIRPAAFGSTLQYSWPRRFFTVRADGARPALAADLRGAVRAVDPALAVGAITRVDELIDERTARHKLAMLTLSFFGVVALVLCALGLYAVVALTSQLRRREYAIRLALGAPRGSVRAAVLTHALVLAAGGAAAGLGAAALGTRALDGMLHGVTPLDPLTFVAATAAVIAVAAIAAWLPARQAARVDPLEALRID